MQKDSLEELINYALSHPEEEIIREVDVAGADGRYFITANGKAISLCGNAAIELVANDNGRGYLYITINGTNYYLHQLVANAFLANDDLEKTQIHHINRERGNNILSNLIRVSPQKHNAIHKFLNKLDTLEDIE